MTAHPAYLCHFKKYKDKVKSMDYKKMYAEKLVSADTAAAAVKSGDWVDYGWTTGTPVAVDAALAKRMPELYNVNFRGGILMWVPEIFKIENPAEHLTWNSWHMSGIERKAIAQGFSYYAPIRYSELPRYYRESASKPDVAIFQVAPMDEHGYFNFGLMPLIWRHAVRHRKSLLLKSMRICRSASAALKM